MKYGFWLFFVLLFGHFVLNAQSFNNDHYPGEGIPSSPGKEINQPASALFVIRNIDITGNKKTKPDIILRELSFKTGDQYLLQDIVTKFQTARQQLLNTALFLDVVVALKSFEGYNVDVLVEVKERWYLFPIPYFKPIDRNFNQWLVEQNASMKRVNYGIKLLYYNSTGRNDPIRVWLLSGYTHQVNVSYDRPYIDKALKWGLNFRFSMGKSREANYNTIGNKQAFLRDSNRYLQNFLDTKIEFTYRKAIKTKHMFGLGYHVQNVSDTIIDLNPDYFSGERTHISYPELYYTLSYFDLDYIPYPTKGYAAELAISEKGLSRSFNALQLSVKGSANWHLWPKTYLNLRTFGSVKLPFNQPYFNKGLLGYNETFMQGYEYYVIDGVAGCYLKAGLSKEFITVKGNFLKRKNGQSLHIPIRIFGKIFGNTGYVYNPDPGNNHLNNKMLVSGGIGIDILTIYDFTIKLEYTFNQLGENGLFLHNKSNF